MQLHSACYFSHCFKETVFFFIKSVFPLALSPDSTDRLCREHSEQRVTSFITQLIDVKSVDVNATIQAYFRRICIDSSEQKGAYISLLINTNKLIFEKGLYS